MLFSVKQPDTAAFWSFINTRVLIFDKKMCNSHDWTKTRTPPHPRLFLTRWFNWSQHTYISRTLGQWWCPPEWAAAEETGQHRRKREQEVERIRGRDAPEESAAKITMFTSMAALGSFAAFYQCTAVDSCRVLAVCSCTLSAVCANISNVTGQEKVSKLSLDLFYNLCRHSELQQQVLLFSSCPVTYMVSEWTTWASENDEHV